MAINEIENYLIDIGYSLEHPDVGFTVLNNIKNYLLSRGDITTIDKESEYLIELHLKQKASSY